MKPIDLDTEDLKVIAKHVPAIQAGKRAEHALDDYLCAIIRRSGANPKHKYTIAGNKIIPREEPAGE